jgi:hypothetical protein
VKEKELVVLRGCGLLKFGSMAAGGSLLTLRRRLRSVLSDSHVQKFFDK